MSEGRCATCRYWEQRQRGKWAAIRKGWGFCRLVEADEDGEWPESLASVTDRYSGLETHETFGCVQWEAKANDR